MRPRLKRLSVVLAALSIGGAGVVAGVLAAPDAHASNNGLSIRPAMGWSSWSFVRRNPTATIMNAQADAMKHSGLADHGYLYVNLDDFFQKCDANGFVVDNFGRWTPDTGKFPGGIKPVADHIHSLGLKFGLYVTPGIPQNAVTKNTPIEGTSFHAKDIADTSKTEKNYSCKHMYFIDYSKPGAQEYVNSFANLYASWGVDYLKIDGVGASDIPDVQAWDKALRQANRPINYALSNNLPIANATTWKQLSNSWRTQGDVECYCSGQPNGVGYPLTTWAKIASRFNSVSSWQQFAGPGNWPDYDSIEIGSGDQEIQDIAGMSKADIRRTQLTLWAMASAPLLLGTDLTLMDPNQTPNPPAGVAADKAMLFNDRVVAVDQDGVAAQRIVNSGGGQVFSKKEADGSFVVALFNTNTSGNLTVSVNWSQVGFTGSGQVTDLWSGASGGTVANSYSASLRPGEPRLIRVVPGTGGGGGSTVEAETGTLAGATRLSNCAACSGGQKVGFIGNGAANFVTVNGLTPSAAGNRTLTITYLLSGSRSFFVSVNGGTGVEVPLTGTSFSTPVTTTITVNFNAGSNSIKFYNNTAYAPDLDKISVN
ncbi:MAG: alpha-galactosidase [Actinobacteria bacterium 13_2_20CM_2_71_6]|nr:MAG: alpha-galactosidase [Actinobacteria bacterium 13_2_20CM_2_71_6]